MAFIDVADLADATSFRRRLAVALVQAAAQVLTETPKAQQAWQDKRYNYALNVVRDPYAVSPAFVWPVLADAAIAAAGLSATDTQLQNRCYLVWDYVAGVVAADKV